MGVAATLPELSEWTLQSSNYNARFCEKESTRLWGIFKNYKEKLSVPRVYTAALIESYAIMHQFS